METQKKPYTPPELTVYGNIGELTQGLSNGNQMDAPFPVHTKTKKHHPTFS